MINREALDELKTICERMGHLCGDEEAQRIGERILKFIINSEYLRPPELLSLEQSAFDLIKNSSTSPSIRAITAAIGLSSSRSGSRVVQSLMRKRLICRNAEGKLTVAR